MAKRRLEDRVVIVTGGGRGIGRGYALYAAANGAKVVVNDFGGSLSGEAGGERPADEVVAEIRAAGGEAVANTNDVASWDGAASLVQRAIDSFGKLDVVINNAGILRDRMIFNMTEQDWDSVMRVHLRGHFCVTRHATAYWREQNKASGLADRVLISTTSISALHGGLGQTNYASAKSALATFALLCHQELNEKYGVRSYSVAPSGRTRLTLSSPNAAARLAAPETGFDQLDPDNVAPFVVWLAAEDCKVPSGNVFGVLGDRIDVYQPWTIAGGIKAGGQRWSMATLDAAAPDLLRQMPKAGKSRSEFLAADVGLPRK
jgi:NAD(P)-dependent dehydrogenase (short-subunit alcohol dehydrogenase family)